MIHEKITVNPQNPHIHMMTYISEIMYDMHNFKKKTVLVLPGGGYRFTGEREAEPIAKAFCAGGMNCFARRHSVNEEAAGYAPLLAAARAIKIIRDNAEKWNVAEDKISDICPAFIRQTADDDLPVENSLYMCEFLAAYQIPLELHIFPYALHDISLAAEETAPISEMSVRWINKYI